MVDPVSVVAGAAVGGAAGKLTEKAWDKGERWLATYFSDHSDEAIEQARENAAEFVVGLAHRIEELEEQLEERGRSREEIEEALQDPDFASTLQEALLISARTSHEEKHDVLARAVANRLGTETESLQAVATRIAVEAIPALTPDQLQYLGLAAAVRRIRPSWWGEQIGETERQVEKEFREAAEGDEELKEQLQEQKHEIRGQLRDRWAELARQWFGSAIEPYSDVPEPTHLDLYHLDAVRCATFRPGFGANLIDVLQIPIEGYEWDVAEFLNTTPAGAKLKECWDAGLQSLTLMPPGALIGIHVHDRNSGSSTLVEW